MDFLRLASVLAVAPIPASLLTAVFEVGDHLSQDEAEARASLAFKQVASRSLAEVTGDNRDARSVHTLVSRTVRFQERDSSELTIALRTAAVEALREEIARVATDARIRGEYELYATHARQLVTSATDWNEASLSARLAMYEYHRGRYAAARELSTVALKFCIEARGEEHPDTGTARFILAQTLFEQGDVVAARQLQEQTVVAFRRALGEDHPDTLKACSSLAKTLLAQGELVAARRLQEQTVAALWRVLGEDHRDTLTACSSLARTLFEQGDVVAARQLQEQTVVASRRALGEDHPDTLTSCSRLADILYAQGDLVGAQQLEEQALASFQRLLGEEHPYTVKVINNLASTLEAQGNLPGARRLEVQALASFRRLLGPEHSDTTISAWNLFWTLRELEEHAAADNVLKRDLLWLLDRDPTALGVDQREIRERVAAVVGQGSPDAKRRSFWRRLFK